MHKKYCDNEKLSPLGTLTTGESSDCQKTQESSRGPQPFRPGSARLHLLPLFHKKGSANIQRGHGTVFASENPIFQRKKRFLAGSALEKSSIFSGDWRGWQWRGSVLPRPPACQFFFYKLKPPAPPVDDCCVSKPSRAVETGSGKRASGRPPPNKSPHEAVRRRFALPRAFEGLNHGKAQSSRLWPCRAADRRL